MIEVSRYVVWPVIAAAFLGFLYWQRVRVNKRQDQERFHRRIRSAQ